MKITNVIHICQSCGMPMSDPHHYGTKENNSPCEEYCHYCYQKGAFTDSGISMDDKIRKSIDIAVKMGMDEEQAHRQAHSVIPTLKRWK